MGDLYIRTFSSKQTQKIAVFDGLTCKGQHIYAMALYASFPVEWSAFIRSFNYAEQQCVDGMSLNVDLSYN